VLGRAASAVGRSSAATSVARSWIDSSGTTSGSVVVVVEPRGAAVVVVVVVVALGVELLHAVSTTSAAATVHAHGRGTLVTCGSLG
jgi:hypothetical protein